jgi:hypothetical protein
MLHYARVYQVSPHCVLLEYQMIDNSVKKKKKVKLSLCLIN